MKKLFLGLITSDWLHIHTRQGRRHMTWEQWHVFHSNKENLFTLYLNLGSREVLVNNWREAGVHSRTSPNQPDYPLLQSCPIQVGCTLHKMSQKYSNLETTLILYALWTLQKRYLFANTPFKDWRKYYRFHNRYIFATRCRLIFLFTNSVRSNIISLKYQWFTSSCCNDIGIRILELVAKTQFLSLHFNVNFKGKNDTPYLGKFSL